MYTNMAFKNLYFSGRRMETQTLSCNKAC